MTYPTVTLNTAPDGSRRVYRVIGEDRNGDAVAEWFCQRRQTWRAVINWTSQALLTVAVFGRLPSGTSLGLEEGREDCLARMRRRLSRLDCEVAA